MNLTIFQEGASPFDQIRQVDEFGTEYWLARQLQPLLGYTQWRRFEETIERACCSYANTQKDVAMHFSVITLKTRGRPKKDYRLSRYACELINLYVDPRKRDRTLLERISEKQYAIKLQEVLGGDREVPTPAGNIDLLTATQLIEIKRAKNWKEAVGQVVVYGDYYPSHERRIHLFEYCKSDFLAMVKSHCGKRRIILTWETDET
jgi:hypothetical protein